MTSQQIQDGERPPFWRSLTHHISVKNYAILIKFGTLQQILNPMTVTWPKIEIKKKIQDGVAFFAITHRPIVRLQWNFVTRKQNGMSTRATWQKLQIFKIQDGERPLFWKSLSRHISVKNRPAIQPQNLRAEPEKLERVTYRSIWKCWTSKVLDVRWTVFMVSRSHGQFSNSRTFCFTFFQIMQQ